MTTCAVMSTQPNILHESTHISAGIIQHMLLQNKWMKHTHTHTQHWVKVREELWANKDNSNVDPNSGLCRTRTFIMRSANSVQSLQKRSVCRYEFMASKTLFSNRSRIQRLKPRNNQRTKQIFRLIKRRTWRCIDFLSSSPKK